MLLFLIDVKSSKNEHFKKNMTFKNVHNFKTTRHIYLKLYQISLRALIFYICKFHNLIDNATRSAFVSADRQIEG